MLIPFYRSAIEERSLFWKFLVPLFSITPTHLEQKELNDMHVDKCNFHRFTAAIDCLCAWTCLSIKEAKWRKNSANDFNCFIVSLRCTTLFETFFLFPKRIAHILPWSGFIHGTAHNVASAHKMRASLSIHLIAWAQNIRKRYKSYHYRWLTRSLVQQNHYSILIYRH